MASAASETDVAFLPRLTTLFAALQAQQQMDTDSFVEAMSTILPVFDNLGAFFHFAKKEMSGKVDSLASAKEQQPTLTSVVETCKKDNTVTVKNSTARNLHRLVSAVDFIKYLMLNLAKDEMMTLHSACADAYNKTMANIHTFVVRTAVRAGMYTLPTRETFLKGLNEAGPDSKEHAKSFVEVADKFTQRVLHLYDGTKMPQSDSTFVG